MASLKQIEANRTNALRSTGPRTPEGKAVAARNAIRTGLYAAKEIVIPCEDSQEFRTLTTEYYDRFDPSTPEQRCLVDDLVSLEWQLRRFRRIEGELLSLTAINEQERVGRDWCLGKAFTTNMDALDRLQRRINATRRAYLKALESLEARKAAEFPAGELEPDALRLPPTQSNEPLPMPIGFVSPIRETPPGPAAPGPGPVPEIGFVSPILSAVNRPAFPECPADRGTVR